ncbi:MAG: hypothetical protein JST44_18350 [Cyanobacteria bacterium SZAS LIN-5]|nr:hypothetical protein [Cyanobacteria bacterium SZAS LIN-5]
MTLDLPNAARMNCHNERSEAVQREQPVAGDPRGDLSRHVQRLFDERGNACRPCDSANRFLPDYQGAGETNSARAQARDQGPERSGGAQDQLQQHRTRLLLDGSASPEQRLAAVRELSNAGINNLTICGNDGQSYNLRLETEQAGSRQLIHLFVTGADGKEQTVLRGVAGQNGQFEREKDRCGNPVGWYGTGAAKLQSVVTADAPDTQRRTLRGAHREDLERPDPYRGPDRYERPDPYRGPDRYERPDPYRGPDRFERPDPYRGPDRYERPDPYRGPDRCERPDPYRAPDRYERPDPYRGPDRYDRPNPYQRGPYDRPNPYERPPYQRPYDGPPDRQFAPPADGLDNPRLRPGPFDGPPQQGGGQWMERAAQDARGQARQLVQTTAGVYVRAGMAVDADGSPRARQIDPSGQVNTSMRYADNRSVNAEVVPYMVLPGGSYQRFGVQLGDMALVRNKDNGRMAIAVFADVGPRNKIGEGSIELARELGLNPSPTRGGTNKNSIEYLVLPNTHGARPRNEQELMARIAEQRRRFGIG